MDIRKLNNESFVDRRKIDSVTGNSGSSASVNDAGKTSLASDRVKLSTIEKGSDVQLGKDILKKLNSASLERVKHLKQQIESGTYDVEKALSNITDRLLNDLKGVEIDQLAGRLTELRTNSSSTTSLRDLNSEALRTLSQHILSDLNRI